MNHRKPAVISALLVALGLVLWLSGCFSDKTQPEAQSSTTVPADPALMAEIEQSLDATKALTSAHLAIRTTGKVDSMLGISSADVNVQAKPLAAKGDCTYNGEAGVPFRIKDDNISVKLFDDWSNLGSVSDLSASRVLDPINGVTKLLSGVNNLQSQGNEVINGIQTSKITGTLPTDSVKILDPGERSPRPATVWIAQDGSHRLVRANVDLGSGAVEVTLSKWNEPVNVD
ncbi:LppX_LprAFG lipoprotein [Mycobacterium ulcerans]|uniref:LppX_LprAFG lipoprotein n=1 Tax=Mycobacterium ulcerans TaxID=1809 RepID=UPI00106A43D0|nr:LppX_LprAFG lipoprotein [Mycobacterium ulcerans]